MSTVTMPELSDFSDKEIQDEYEDRFGAPDDPNLKDFTTSDLLEELERRDGLPDTEPPVDEVIDLIAEAARVSPHATRAYELIRAEWPEALPMLAARQMLISGRMAL